ncbi:hypothetical protein TERTU_1762 [Teredinibacter turnerae T7901]|uniref:Uncharacterized protein n=1 Tax=Teredinibacter turnerae (strain ATCC 39867 / T7901) TaxID=377629 RepID=C5BU95_TERTT|nr:hypothetical protein TERTU_1762 [Teredinibacter turnerae T7901]
MVSLELVVVGSAIHNNQHQAQPLRGLDLHFGASRLHCGPCAGRYKAPKTLTLKRYFLGKRCGVVWYLVPQIRALLGSSYRVLNVVLALGARVSF